METFPVASGKEQPSKSCYVSAMNYAASEENEVGVHRTDAGEPGQRSARSAPPFEFTPRTLGGSRVGGILVAAGCWVDGCLSPLLCMHFQCLHREQEQGLCFWKPRYRGCFWKGTWSQRWRRMPRFLDDPLLLITGTQHLSAHVKEETSGICFSRAK